jgi:hypothetical protein
MGPDSLDSKEYFRQLIEAADVPLSLRRVSTAGGIVLLVGIAFFVLLQSPLGPGSVNYPDKDSSLFLYTASQILDGTMPYRDIFDYHAPLIYLIDALGMLFAGQIGVWFLEVLFLAATLVILFLALNHDAGPVPAFLSTLIVAALAAYSLQGGNRIEEYALLFQVIALASFLDYFQRRELTLACVYFIGISAALTLCLNPFLIAFWIPFVLVILALVFKREGLIIGITRTLAVLFSTTIAFILLTPWLSINNALISCYEQVVVFGGELAALATQQPIVVFQNLAVTLPFILVVFISLAAVIKLCITRDQEPVFTHNDATIIVTNLVATLAVYGAMALQRGTEEHILLQGVICLAIPLTYVFHLFVRGFLQRSYLQTACGAVFVVLLCVVVIVPGCRATIAAANANRMEQAGLIEQNELVTVLLENRTIGEPIIVFGNDCWVYTAIDSYSATRYAYQPFDAAFRPDLNADFYRQVDVARAPLLVERKAEGFAQRYPGIDQYERIFESPTYTVYRRLE